MARWLVRHHNDRTSGGRGLVVIALGLAAGVAAGAYLAHRFGGVTGISSRVRRRMQGAKGPPGPRGVEADGGPEFDDAYETYDEYEEEGDFAAADDTDGADGSDAFVGLDDADDDDLAADDEDESFDSADPELEDRVLHAFTNDPVLSEREIDIGAVSDRTIELTGTVNTDEEYEHATVVTRGVPGVETVVNRLTIRDDEVVAERTAQRYADGDPRLTEARWENERVGTGRPRQGTSQDVGRHADPKVPLETRALDEDEAIRDAADDLPGPTTD